MIRSIIPIFIPHQGCPHQCVFCNQDKISGVSTTISPDDIRKIIKEALPASKQQPEIAFYGGSFTALPLAVQEALLTPAHETVLAGQASGIRISTRPDYISPQILTKLSQLNVTTIELGAQSLNDNVLQKAGREHSSTDIEKAIQLIKTFSFQCGLQLMVGLPGEDWSSLIHSAFTVAKLNPDFLRVYPTVVICNTPLADLYKNDQYLPLTMDEAIARCAYLKIYLQYIHGIPIIRTGLQASDFLEQEGTVLAGPYHPSFGELVEAHIFFLMMSHVFSSIQGTHATIRYFPKDHSKLRGIHSSNILKIKKRYPQVQHLTLIADGEKEGQLSISIGTHEYIVNKQMLFYI